MIYTELTNKAMELAYEAHMGQKDTSGIPYIFHPYHLAELMDNETRTCIALLHDVVEDTAVTLEEMRADFPAEITDALELLTHADSVDYYEYVKKVCTNPNAAFVKLADLVHNMSEDRLIGTNIGTEERDRWFQKYNKAVHIVTEYIEHYLREHCDSETIKEESALYCRIKDSYRGADRPIVWSADGIEGQIKFNERK